MVAELAVVVAAGIGSRLRPFTDETPKCMLHVQNKPMLHRALDTFRNLGIPRSVVIGGYRSDKLVLPDCCELVLNQEYQANNILHSLAYARKEMDGVETVLVSYSDIVFRNSVVERLLSPDSADIAIVVDQAWAERYDGRKLHPLSEAESARFDDRRLLHTIGKGMLTAEHDAGSWGEFIGMMKLNRRGQEVFWGVFDEVHADLAPEAPFQRASSWRQAYITDLLQELIDRGVEVHCSLIQGGWLEIDTVEDYETASVFEFSEGCS